MSNIPKPRGRSLADVLFVSDVSAAGVSLNLQADFCFIFLFFASTLEYRNPEINCENEKFECKVL